MTGLRLSHTARNDIIDILAWSHDRFGTQARLRYERLITTALRDIARDPACAGSLSRPELGDGVRTYHLRHSRDHAGVDGRIVLRPRHLIVYRPIGDRLIGIGRVLHDAMELERHMPSWHGGA